MFGKYFAPRYFGDRFFGDGADTGNATASGQLLTAIASLVAGQATGTGQATGGGSGPREFPQPPLIRSGEARGKLLVVKARIIPGRARSFSLIAAGTASGSAVANGQALELNVTLAVGGASGGATIQTEIKALSVSILPGEAAGIDDDEDAIAAWLLAA